MSFIFVSFCNKDSMYFYSRLWNIEKLSRKILLLARAGLGISSEDRWVESPPVFILDVLLEDNQV